METSLPWTGGGGGDDGPYSSDDWNDMEEMLWIGDEGATRGVARGYLGELAATEPAANTVRIATGGAVVKGCKYRSTTTEDFNIPTPVGATRVDLIVLRKIWGATQTIRLFRIAGAEGAGDPGITQNDGVTWDIRLWQVTITVGDVITLVDQRDWLRAPIENQTENYADRSITEDKLALGVFVPIGGIIFWSGAIVAIPTNWALCDGTAGTPNLVDRFIVGAGNLYAVGATGGALTHTHAVNFATDLGGSHNHTGWTGTRDIWANPVAGSGAVSIYTDTPATLHKHSITTDPHHQHGVNGNTGSGSSLPPYYALALMRRQA